MKVQRKTTRPKVSRKDRELEQLLRRAALYFESHPAAELQTVRKKRVAAA